jgi:hypothetical protein
MKTMSQFDPALTAKFKKDAVRLGKPARDAVNKVFRSVPKVGPLGAPKRPGRTFDKMYTTGRLSWAETRSRRNAVDVNYKARSGAQFSRSSLAGDKTLSVIRVRVRGAAFVFADLAMASGKARKTTGQVTRPYRINLFGKGYVIRTHKVNSDNVDNWIDYLNKAKDAQQGHPSRFAWPTIIKHGSDYRKNFSNLVSEVVADTNRRMQR